MTVFVALLRAVNVGGTGKIPMAELRGICEDLGFEDVRTYIQSGNVVFGSGLTVSAVQSALETRLSAKYERPVGVIVRDAKELSKVLERNPFPSANRSQVAVLFLDKKPAANVVETARGRSDEEIKAGFLEIYIHYPSGMGRSRLRLPAMDFGTARNLNTVAKLAEMAADGN